jgi:hypothetical protein
MNRISTMHYPAILERRRSVAKSNQRFSRRVSIALVIFCLGALAALLALQTPRGTRIYIKVSQRVPQVLEQFYNRIIFGLIPGTPVSIQSTQPASTASVASTYPLKKIAGTRYLVDQNNTPFFWVGDSAWSLIAQLNKADADLYLENRRQKGFNTVMVNLIEHEFATYAPSNIYQNKPFTGKTFTTPNEAYFAHADYVITSAANKGIVVLLAPLYLGYNCGTEGWCGEVKSASLADMQAWGTYVGNRYKNYDNIVWLIGGDTDPVANGVQSKVQAFVAALRAADTRHVLTAHNAPEQLATDPAWTDKTWITFNSVYTYNVTYQLAKRAYNYTPTLPFIQLESSYENEHGISQKDLRAEAYYPVLSGGFGFQFGNGQIWCFSAPTCFASGSWKSQLNNQGSISMAYVAQFFESIAWQKLVPDFNHQVLTGGYGSDGSWSYVTAAFSSDSNFLVAYLPTRSAVTVDMTKFSGPVTGRWYDPSNGKYSTITGSPFSNSGTHNFTPPSNNAGGESDWVLYLAQGQQNLFRWIPVVAN